jgi:lipoprotein-releasing system permease protein
MRLFIRLAWTFLCKKNSRSLSFTAWVSFLGVSLGVCGFLVVTTVLKSFEMQLKQTIYAANPNVIVFSPGGIPNASSLINSLLKISPYPLKHLSRFIYQEVILTHKGIASAAYVRAIEGTHSASASELIPLLSPLTALQELNTPSSVISIRKVKTQDPSLFPKIILGKDLAQSLGVTVGDTVQMITFSTGASAQDIDYNPVYVSGIIHLGISQYDERYALMNYHDGTQLFTAKGWATGIEIALHNPEESSALAHALDKKLPYNTKAWQDIDQNLFEQIARDSTAIKLIVFIISFVAGFNIVITLYLTVLDRSKNIALLRSIGASQRLILSVVVISGACIGFLGGILGLGLGGLMLYAFAHVPLGDLQSFYFLEKIPVHYDFVLFGFAFLTAIVLSFIGALYPAWKASRISPLHGLKAFY